MSVLSENSDFLIKKYNLKINQIAEECGIERSLLSKFKKGTRSLSPRSFKKMLGKLNIADSEKKTLTATYIDDYFGTDKYAEYLKILSKFSEHEPNQKDYGIKYKISAELNFKNNIMHLHSGENLLTAARYLIGIEIDRENGRIYSNIPSSSMLKLMQSFPNKIVDFKHIVSISSIGDYHFNMLSQIFELMSLGYISNYTSSPSGIYEQNDLIYPFYIIFTDRVLLVDKELKRGIICDNADFAKHYADVFLNQFKYTDRYAYQCDNILSLKAMNEKLYSSEIESIYSFGTMNCQITTSLTLDMWEQIAKPDVPNREYLRDMTYAYYQKLEECVKNMTLITSRKSLDDFISNGTVKTMPREYAYPLSKDNRIKLLQIIYDKYREENFDFYLFEDMPSFTMSDNLGIEVISNTKSPSQLNICYETENSPMHYYGNIGLRTDNKIAVQDIANFLECFIISSACHSKEDSLKILKEAIQKCQMMPK